MFQIDHAAGGHTVYDVPRVRDHPGADTGPQVREVQTLLTYTLNYTTLQTLYIVFQFSDTSHDGY